MLRALERGLEHANMHRHPTRTNAPVPARWPVVSHEAPHATAREEEAVTFRPVCRGHLGGA